MAVEIVKPGRPRWQDQSWFANCTSCGCQFTFLGGDAERWSSVRNEEGLKLPCPSCGQMHHTDRVYPPPARPER